MDILTKITTVFPESVFTLFNERRFGIKRCKNIVDPELADDLLNIYKRSLEMKNCNGAEFSAFCSHEKIEERIKTL